jgi:antitoxin component of RelBE/YafQ-DinJ toxin-antitoxin module
MGDSKRTGNVTVTLRIPVDIYSQIEAVANDYDVSISAAFRIFLKHLQTAQTQQKTVTVGEANSNKTPQTQHNIVKPDNPKQILTEQTKQKILNAWGDEA